MRHVYPTRVVAWCLAFGSIGCSIDINSNEMSVREEQQFTLSGSAPVELTLRTFDGAIQVRS